MKINKLNSISRFLIYTCAIVIPATITPAFADNDALSNIKKEITELEEILFNPDETQLAVLLSVNTKTSLKIDSVSFYLDSKKTKKYLYTDQEGKALLNNAIQKIYVGKISEGEHIIKAQFSAIDVNAKKYKISSTSKFTKTNTTKYVELMISKSEQQDIPVLNIKIWE